MVWQWPIALVTDMPICGPASSRSFFFGRTSAIVCGAISCDNTESKKIPESWSRGVTEDKKERVTRPLNYCFWRETSLYILYKRISSIFVLEKEERDSPSFSSAYAYAYAY